MKRGGNAQKEQFYSESAIPEKKRKTWLLVLGWIFIFPVPLTILMFNSPRTEKLDKKVRAIIVVVAWILYLIIGFGGAGNNNASTSTSTSTSTVAEQLADTSVSSNTANDEDKNTQENKYAEDDVVDAFIFSYNEISNSPFSDITEGNIRTKYHAYSYGYYCDLLNSNATNKIDVTINETDDNADDGVAGMREIFHDVMKAIDPSLADDDIYDYFDTMVTDKQSKGTLSTAEISFSPDVDYQRGHITISAQ